MSENIKQVWGIYSRYVDYSEADRIVGIYTNESEARTIAKNLTKKHESVWGYSYYVLKLNLNNVYDFIA